MNSHAIVLDSFTEDVELPKQYVRNICFNRQGTLIALGISERPKNDNPGAGVCMIRDCSGSSSSINEKNNSNSNNNKTNNEFYDLVKAIDIDHFGGAAFAFSGSPDSTRLLLLSQEQQQQEQQEEEKEIEEEELPLFPSDKKSQRFVVCSTTDIFVYETTNWTVIHTVKDFIKTIAIPTLHVGHPVNKKNKLERPFVGAKFDEANDNRLFIHTKKCIFDYSIISFGKNNNNNNINVKYFFQNEHISATSLSPSGKFYAIGDQEHVVTVIDTSTNQIIWRFDHAPDQACSWKYVIEMHWMKSVFSIDWVLEEEYFTSTSSRLAVSGDDVVVRVHEQDSFSTSRILFSVDLKARGLSLSYSPELNLLLVGTEENMIRIFSMKNLDSISKSLQHQTSKNVVVVDVTEVEEYCPGELKNLTSEFSILAYSDWNWRVVHRLKRHPRFPTEIFSVCSSGEIKIISVPTIRNRILQIQHLATTKCKMSAALELFVVRYKVMSYLPLDEGTSGPVVKFNEKENRASQYIRRPHNNLVLIYTARTIIWVILLVILAIVLLFFVATTYGTFWVLKNILWKWVIVPLFWNYPLFVWNSGATLISQFVTSPIQSIWEIFVFILSFY